MRKLSLPFYTSAFFAAILTTGAASAEGTEPTQRTPDAQRSDTGAETRTQSQTDRTMASGDAKDARDAQELVQEAEQVVAQMKRDPQLLGLLEQAQGVLIVPEFGKAAAVVGASGGQGVLLVRSQNAWSGPAFYDIGSISVGAQAGGAAGSIAMLLMNDRAIDSFKKNKNNFSLDAQAGLTVVDYSEAAQATAGESDVVLWSDTQGLFAGASVAVKDIRRDDDENEAYYDRQTTPQQIVAGSVKNPHADDLRKALPDRVASR